jgi:carboxypeptidase C (cathepsin A)
MKSLQLLLTTLALSAAVVAARAQDQSNPARDRAADKPSAATPTPGESDPAPSVTEHAVTIGGKVVRYKATAGYLVLRDAKGSPTANMFYTAYTKLGDIDVAKRPVTFSFNGGPGASSVWLHMGGLGPKRVNMGERGEAVPPPATWSDNPWSWLDETDLVFVDPMSTGFTRPAKGAEAKPFHGFTGDLESLADFIQIWTTRNLRWASPKFLVGESYGTTRVAALTDRLQQKYDMYLNGVMLVSAIMNFQTARFAPGNDLPYPLFLPTYTATAWYHGRLQGDWAKTLADALKRAEIFAARDYTLALMEGDALAPEDFDRIAGELAELTGLSVDFAKRHNLRVSIWRFIRELRRDEGIAVGRLDSSVAGVLDESEEGPGGGNSFDPSMEAINGPYANAISDYLRRDLKFETDLHYEVLTNVQPWDYTNVQNTYLNVAENLKRAMTRNAFMKVWIANGYYDLATPYYATDWTVRHMNLPPAVRGNISQTFYEAGHMMYTHVPSQKQLKEDFVRWFDGVLREQKLR